MKTKTNRTVMLNRLFAVGLLVLLIGITQVWARGGGRGGRSGSRSGGRSRGGGNRGSVRHSSSSRRSAPSRRSSARSRPSTGRQPARTQPVRSRQPVRTQPVRGGDRNINRNVNVSGGGHYHHNWDDARRDWMRYRTVNHLIRAGTYWATRPKYSTAVVVSGTSYYYWGGMYYVSSGTGYVVVSPPPTAVVYAIPVAATPVYAGSTVYYYYGGTYYAPTTKPADEPKGTETTVNVNVSTDASATETKPETMDTPEMTQDDSNYEVVTPPVGATVPYLPDEAKEETVGGKKYFVSEGAYYRPFVSDGETIYMIVKDPKVKPTKVKKE